MNEVIKRLVETLELVPHPEGGFFRETYRSSGTILKDLLGEQYKGDRNFCTCIYFLLTSDSFSAFHKIRQDEIWHFYQGAPIELHQIAPSGHYSKSVVGNNITAGHMPQLVVPGGNWFAAGIPEPYSYALVGCTVAPGFDFQDFILADRNTLIAQFPEHSEIIKSYTRS